MDVTCDDGSHLLSAGQLLYLPGGVQHGVVGVEDASALMTIVLGK
jgi:quercetin dioxygenase-like cupin family protein